MVKTQRVIALHKQFMHYHNDGKTIPEIAEIMHVSAVTVYRELGEIAKENGVSRESLLICPKSPTALFRRKVYTRKENPSEEEIFDCINTFSTEIDIFVNELKGVLHI